MSTLLILLCCFVGIFLVGPTLMLIYTFVYRRGIRNVLDNMEWVSYHTKVKFNYKGKKKYQYVFIRQVRKIYGDIIVYMQLLLATVFHPSLPIGYFVNDVARQRQ